MSDYVQTFASTSIHAHLRALASLVQRLAGRPENAEYVAGYMDALRAMALAFGMEFHMPEHDRIERRA